MARLIEAVKCAEIISEKFNIPLADLVDVFAEIPAADVVEVVRCEKCIHSEDYNGRILCNKNAHIFDKNDF